MKIFELNKKYENEIINIKVGDLVKLVEEGCKDYLFGLPTFIKDDFVVSICMPILKKYVKVKEDKAKKEEQAKLEKELENNLDKAAELIDKILKIERGE